MTNPWREDSVKRAFLVMEIIIRNSYQRNIVVGRFQVNRWMYEDHFTPYFYAPTRDYRAFNLYTREAISLDSYHTLAPGAMFGLRLEVWETADNGNYRHPSVELPAEYRVEYMIDTRKVRKTIKVTKQNRISECDFESRIYHWSDLIASPRSTFDGAPLPQRLGSPWPSPRIPWSKRLRIWWTIKNNLLLYGTRYPSRDQSILLTERYRKLKVKLRTYILTKHMKNKKKRDKMEVSQKES